MPIATTIKRLLEEQGLTANALSISAGLPRDAISDILKGKSKNPRADTIAKIARALGVDPAVLILGNAIPSLPASMGHEIMLPVRFAVAAGLWREVEDWQQVEPEMQPVPSSPGYDGLPQWLERVEGDSMDRIVPPGSYIHVVDAIALEYEPKTGDLVVVERTRDQGALRERSLKQIEVTKGVVRLWPRSHNARWSQPLEFSDGGDHDDEVVQTVGVVIRAFMNLL